MRRAAVILMALLILVACGGDGDDPQVQNVTQLPTVRNFPTTQPTVFVTATPTNAFAIIGNTNPLTGCPIPTGWQAYFVEFGDTLGVIATSINSTVAIIQQGNCFNSETIFVDQLLFLPSLPAGVPTVSPVTLANLSAVPTAATGSTAVFFATSTPINCNYPTGWVPYVVQAGDTLGTLATRTNTTVGVLQNGNCLVNSEIIFINQTLYLPRTPDAVAPTTVFATSVVATPTPNTSCIVPAGWQPYTILPGDTISGLAITYGTTSEVLANGNCLDNAEIIFVGQTIYLPPVGTVILPTATATQPGVGITPIATATSTATTVPSGDLPNPLPAPVIRPTQLRQDGALVTLQQTIAMDVGEVTDADRVVYLLSLTPDGADPVQIGVDDDPFDGTEVSYTINTFDSEIYIFAAAENEFGRSSSPIVFVVYDPTYTIDSGKAVVSPFIGFDGNIYTLEHNRLVTVSWLEAPSNATRVDFYVNENGVDELIGTDLNLADGARVTWQVVAPLQGTLIARASTGAESESVFVYSEELDN